jgi:UDP-N-acetylglucosamine 2-epimerase (non-hydrolysing)
MAKILTVFGTRPEAIKLAPVVKTTREHPRGVQSVVCVTSQHREMLDQVLESFEIVPDYDLNVMRAGQSLTDVTRLVLEKIEGVIGQERPDVVLVQGDTTTTFAAGLAAFYHKVRVGHVEAGLRTFDRYQPFPEELNRRLTSVLADFHFAPTNRAKQNLLNEGIPERNVSVTGNTGIDSLLMTLERIRRQDPSSSPLASLFEEIRGRKIILVTAHRRENFGPGFDEICGALIEIVERNPETCVVYPVHLNPNVREPVERILAGTEAIKLIAPLGYLAFVELLDRAHLVLTDSGGIQEEAPSLGKPVLVLRNVTERQEAIEAGTARLVGTDSETIVSETEKILRNAHEYKKMSATENPFGDGRSSQRIIDQVLSALA